tara:strand:- start:5 stop:1018 length:1014 start_codon:yes stop_codon:yes gene_type:complete
MNKLNSFLEITHVPVMLEEVLELCSPLENKSFLDCTFGGGGYSSKLLSFDNTKVTAIDRDSIVSKFSDPLKIKFPERFKFYNERFSNLNKVIENQNFDAVIFDLGLSSFQIKDLSRGFSFQSDEKLDMCMGLSNISVEEVINNFEENDLKNIIKTFGEESEAKYIARNIIKKRKQNKITTTKELVQIIEKSKKRDLAKKINICTKTFQAFRIFVNQEISELIKGIIEATKALKPGGVLVTVSFHSIEDKIIKFYFKNYSSNKSKGSRYLPETNKEDLSLFENYRNKVITASEKEIKSNLPSRSAKLRFATRNRNKIVNFFEFNQKFENYLKIESLHA